MSRKAHADKSDWHTFSLYAFVGGYGPFKLRGADPIENAVVVLKHQGNESHAEHHPLYFLAGEAQELLLKNRTYQERSILVVDLTTAATDTEGPSGLEKEKTEKELVKGFGKTLLKLLERLCLLGATFVAHQDGCPLLLKLVRALSPEVCSAIWLLHPTLTPKFVNSYFVTTELGVGRTVATPKLHVVFESELARDRRLDLLRHFYPQGSNQIQAGYIRPGLAISSFLGRNSSGKSEEGPFYNPEYFCEMGKSLFFSSLKVEMSKYTKQYERSAQDITAELSQVGDYKEATSSPITNPTDLDWSTAERQIGALVVRGNRCVLVRSLMGAWEGMKIPSLVPTAEETAHSTAIRSVVHFLEVDATEVEILPDVPPVEIFTQQKASKPVRIQLWAFYATSPPPDGPLEDADMEDDEDPYDWYTFRRAAQKLAHDPRTIAGLQIMALTLIERANVGLIPCKWGGVFGQELQLTIVDENYYNQQANSANAKKSSTLPGLNAAKEEWQYTEGLGDEVAFDDDESFPDPPQSGLKKQD